MSNDFADLLEMLRIIDNGNNGRTSTGRPIYINRNKLIKYMEKKEPKRDKNGRFTKKKVEVKFEVEPKPASENPKMVSISEDDLNQLRLERDAFKMTAERMSSNFFDERNAHQRTVSEFGEILNKLKKESIKFKERCEILLKVSKKWKKRALCEEDKHLFAMDALRTASMHIWWLRKHLSWFKLWRFRKKLADMDIELDRMVAHAEGLDRE